MKHASRFRSSLAIAIAMTLPIGVAVFAGQTADKPMIVEGGLSTPESVLHDATADVYLVSNINGNPSVKDGNGFISRVSPDGSMRDLKWIDGARAGTTLSAPKGMALRGNTLLVADIDAIRLFDRTSGKPTGSWSVPGSTFLNDVAIAADGTVYATDTGIDLSSGEPAPTGTAAVHRFDKSGKPTAVAKGKQFQGPNGVLAEGDDLTVVEFMSNRVLRVGWNGAVSVRFSLPTGGLDGVVRLDDGSLLVSSWEGSAVYRVDQRGKAEAVVKNVPAPADLGLDVRRHRLLIPQFTENKLRIVLLPGR